MGKTAKTDSELAELYDYLYSHADKMGRLYGFSQRRCSPFMQYFLKNIPIGSSVLEVGCGRGYLLRWLDTMGYKALGTEIADCLLEGDLKGLPVQRLFCSELDKIQSKFDVVVSSDVLEHLQTVEDVEKAVSDFARLSKRWILVSVGTRAATSLCGQVHSIIRPKEWWVKLFNNYCKIEKFAEECGSLFIYADVS